MRKDFLSHLHPHIEYHHMFNLKKKFRIKYLLIPVVFLFSIMSLSANELSDNAEYNTLLPYFYAAARTGDDEVVNEFLNAGLPIDVKNNKGYTALMIATYNGKTSIVNTLIKRGANVCAKDHRGNTALMAAIFRAEFKIANTLMKSDCDTNQQNNAGQTAVMYATLFGRDELKNLLIARGADVELQDKSGNSAKTIQAY